MRQRPSCASRSPICVLTAIIGATRRSVLQGAPRDPRDSTCDRARPGPRTDDTTGAGTGSVAPAPHLSLAAIGGVKDESKGCSSAYGAALFTISKSRSSFLRRSRAGTTYVSKTHRWFGDSKSYPSWITFWATP